MTLPPTKYAQRAQLIAFYNSAIQHVQPLPGVEAVALATAVPAYATHQTPALFEGQPQVPLGRRPIVNIQQISPDYAKALRVPILAGRAFTGHDDAQAPAVAILNQRAVRRFWPNENPIGKRVWIGNLPVPFEVVGVLGDTKNYGLALAPQPEVFLPLPQLPWSLLYMSVRTAIDPHSVISSVRRAIAEVDRDQPVTRVLTGDELLESACAQPRFTMFLLGVFSATAFVLAVIGIYGVIAYSVAQRTPEIGIRIALGAARGDIFRLVIGNGLVLTLAGILIGLGGAFALTRVMSSMLYQTSATDPLTFLMSSALFTAVAIAASYVPARRATRIDPTDALRSG
jgi:predicted permease